MSIKPGFTEAERDVFRQRIRQFIDSSTKADRASAILSIGNGSLAVDGLFRSQLMLFAVHAPTDFNRRVAEMATDGYQDATVVIQLAITGTLPMRFKVVCALTSTPPNYAGWVVLDLIRDP